MGFLCRVFGFRVLSLEFWVSDCRFGVSIFDFRVRVSGFEFRVSGLTHRGLEASEEILVVQLLHGVSGFEIRVWVSGMRRCPVMWVTGFRICRTNKSVTNNNNQIWRFRPPTCPKFLVKIKPPKICDQPLNSVRPNPQPETLYPRGICWPLMVPRGPGGCRYRRAGRKKAAA